MLDFVLAALLSATVLSADIPQDSVPSRADAAPRPVLSDQTLCLLPQLPRPHTNNAVASFEDRAGTTWLFSVMGLRSGKKHQHISKEAFRLKVGDTGWEQLPDLPVTKGRLASTAQVVGGTLFVFGGYSVAADGTEKSEPEVFAYNADQDSWERRADMPTPVDDSVSVTYRDRYVYLISGWHDVGNVNFVQMYDTEADTWERVTTFPGKAVFGHAGGIVDNRFVVVDGVAVTGVENGRRTFGVWPQGWMGTIDPDDVREISWRRLPALPGKPLYRMAGMGDEALGRILFAGGSDVAYNYDGIGYTGTPAGPTAHVFSWNLVNDRWETLDDKPLATMDHRAMVRIQDGFYSIGGMLDYQRVTGELNPAVGAPDCESVFD